MIDEIKKYLAETTLIQLSDILSLYETPAELRFQNNWTAYCKRYKNDNEAVYCSKTGEDEPRNYFSKDIKYSYICKLGSLPEINFNHSFNPKLEEKWEDNEIIIKAENFKFERDTIYEIFEKFSDFDYKIAQDIDNNKDEYEKNFNRLFKDIKSSSEDLLKVTDREKQIDIACDLSKPFLIIQGPPGTGKTSFISDMIVKLIKSDICEPSDIVCLAQTNRAANEIRNKIEEYVSKEDIPAIQDIGKIANDSICISTIHKNPNQKGRIGRKIVLLDEASQISIPLLLYGLRYSSNDSVFRFFGDERQLAPTSSFIRNIERVPNKIEDLEKYFKNYEIFEKFLANNMKINFPEIFDQKNLEKILKDVMLSPFAQSIFSILSFNDLNNTQIIDRQSLENIMTYKMICNSNFRHEPEIHNHHKKVFYPDINYQSKFNYVEANLKDISSIQEEEKRNIFLQKISINYDIARARKFINSISSVIYDILNAPIRFIGKFFKSTNKLDKKELDNINKDIKPFDMETDDDILNHFKEFFQNNIILNELNSIGLKKLSPEVLFRKMKFCLRNKIVIITHDFPQEEKSNINRFEGILSCLFLYLWGKEDYRISKGFGVVVPYRNQECYTTKLYIRAFGNPFFNKPTADWCATPERFQGRDISRAVYCCVNSNMDCFKEVSTMFSENKLNVATSRASNQQVLIVNRHLINRNNIEELKDFANIRKEGDDEEEYELSKRILLNYPIRYLEKLCTYLREAENNENSNICEMFIL
jgi:adenylate kinase family enzyme